MFANAFKRSLASFNAARCPIASASLRNANIPAAAAPALWKRNISEHMLHDAMTPPDAGPMGSPNARDAKDLVVFRDQSVDNIIKRKEQTGRAPVLTISPNMTVYDAIKKMSRERVGALVVVDEQCRPVGMVSERDYLNKVVLRGLASKQALVKDIMTQDIVTIPRNVTAGECMELMTSGRFRHVPVVDGDRKMVGLVSIGDLVKYVLDQQKETIHYLKEYIERTY